MRALLFQRQLYAVQKYCHRTIRHKPWMPRFRLLRNMQPWDAPFELNKTDDWRANEVPSELRDHLKRNGLLPPLVFQDIPINLGHSDEVIDPYLPPEDFRVMSSLSAKRLIDVSEKLLKKGKSYRDILKIKQYEPTFNSKTFVSEAETIYKETHILLQDVAENEEKLFTLVTEKAFDDMSSGLRFRTLKWDFVSSIEAPSVVQVRTLALLNKENLFGQVTVRFHTRQILAIFNRFGRLIFGNPDTPVDVLEYIIFEKHITDEYGVWRLHAKLQRDNMSTLVDYHPTERLLFSRASAQID